MSEGQIFSTGCCLPATALSRILETFLSLNSSHLSVSVFPLLSRLHSFQSELQSTISPEEERSTVKTVTSTFILMGLMDKTTDHSYIPHESYTSSCSVQVVYHSVLTDGNGLVRWMEWYSMVRQLKVKPMLLLFFHLAEAFVFRSGCRVSPSSLMTRDSP